MPPQAVLETLAALWATLDELASEVAIAGGLALSFWGHPRSTRDVDLTLMVDKIRSRSNLCTGDILLRHQKRDQHAGPDNVEEMPITGAVIDRPMTLMIITVASCLIDDPAEKNNAADHVQRVNEGKRERHSIDFGGSVDLTEMLSQ